MRSIKAVRERDSKILAMQCYVAEGFMSRLIGLMWENVLKESEGLWLLRCNSIHTFFMKFSIDAVFLNRENVVMAVHRDLKPWRIDFPVFGASSVLEVRAGVAGFLMKGERLCLS